MTFVERLWFGAGPADRAARLLLAPVSAGYRFAMMTRNALFDRGVLGVQAVALPTLSVGNLTVGGTGKTPMAAWFVTALRALHAHPAVVLRGYGGDEAAVHRHENPAIAVIEDADRVRGIARAKAEGCDVAVLDDAFQHRRAARDEDVVLISADRWSEPIRTLPSGPWRESLAGLRRASLVVVTHKAAPFERASALAARLGPLTSKGRHAVAWLALADLREVNGERTLAAEQLRGERTFAFAGVADPTAFEAQLRSLGARVEMMRFPDHHAYSTTEIADLVARGGDAKYVVCTLKDAVKLQDRWPRQGPALWYFSQRVEVEQGRDVIDEMLRRLLRARPTPDAAG